MNKLLIFGFGVSLNTALIGWTWMESLDAGIYISGMCASQCTMIGLIGMVFCGLVALGWRIWN